MKVRYTALGRAAALILVLGSPAFGQQGSGIKERLDERLGAIKDATTKATVEKSLNEAIRDFYAKREYRPLWFDDAGSARAKALLNALSRASEHGLNPATYGLPALIETVAKADVAKRDEVDIALSRAFIDYAGDISSGVVENPRKVGGIFRDAKRPDPKKLLDEISTAKDIAGYLDNLPPDSRRYKILKAALAKYREMERKGGWAAVDKGPTLKPGMRNVRIIEVRRRLAASGDYKPGAGPSDYYDDALVAAVKRFQMRHGLKDDGNIGADTVAEMNVPVKERIEQIVINLERRRWLAAHLGDRYIYVNIADNDLKVVERDKAIYTSRVVVGKPYHETPVFSGMMTYIELNPYWNVPPSIATKELLPLIQKTNGGYLSANEFLVLTRMGDNSSAIDPGAVDWSTVSAQNFPYQLRQMPGAKNALGTTLFMFPNPHNVFLHDTPARALFSLEDRFFSHGCVRVENPVKLALLLLKDQEGGAWSEQRIRSIQEGKAQTRIDLKQPIPVHITYLTAWAEPDGTVHFRKDAYKRDTTLKKAIQQIASAK
jgi:murein L,D-transpeptidase YcbB/YkuD